MSFCSRASLASDEPMAGTAVRAAAYVFLPVDKRFWRSAEMNDLWASPAEISAIRGARKAGVVTRLYNPLGDRAFIVARSAEGSAPPLGLEPLLEIFQKRWPLDEGDQRRLAICTHGTRDRCCAKFGFTAYTRARALFEKGLSPFEPMETSHLGGDRFAATGIFFPSGNMFAHLDELDLAMLTTAEASGVLEATNYRGSVFETPIAQLVRAALASRGLLEPSRARLEIEQEDGARLRVRAAGQAFVVKLRNVETTFFGSCEKMIAGRPSKGERLAVESLEPAIDAGLTDT